MPRPDDAARNLVAVPLTAAGERARRYGHAGAVLWLTGLPGSGKSTIAIAAEARLIEAGRHAYVLDGDNLRGGLCRDLGFSPADRHENIRRAGEVAALFADAGMIVLASFISPYRADRDRARAAAAGRFHEVYVKAGAAACERRDPKGHYRRARAGEIPDFTGITNDYEIPSAPQLTLDTERDDTDACVRALLAYCNEKLVPTPAQ